MSDTMTAAEAAAALGYTRAWVVRLVQAGKLKGERIGPERRGVWQIDRVSVEAYKSTLDTELNTNTAAKREEPPNSGDGDGV